MASVHPVVDVAFADLDATLGGTAGADGQDEVGVLIADHGSGVVWGVVGGRAGGFTSRAVDDDARWVAGVVLHRRHDLHTAG